PLRQNVVDTKPNPPPPRPRQQSGTPTTAAPAASPSGQVPSNAAPGSTKRPRAGAALDRVPKGGCRTCLAHCDVHNPATPFEPACTATSGSRRRRLPGGSLRNDAASRAGPQPSGLLAAPTSAGRRGQLDTRSPADGSEIGSSHSGTLPRSTRLVPTPARVRLRSWARGSRPLGHPPGLRAAASYAEWNDGILPASAASPDGAPSH